MMNFLDVAPLPGGGLYGEGGSLLALLLALGCLIVIAGACAGLVLLLRARSKDSARRKEGPPACDQDATAPSEALTPAQDEIAPPAFAHDRVGRADFFAALCQAQVENGDRRVCACQYRDKRRAQSVFVSYLRIYRYGGGVCVLCGRSVRHRFGGGRASCGSAHRRDGILCSEKIYRRKKAFLVCAGCECAFRRRRDGASCAVYVDVTKNRRFLSVLPENAPFFQFFPPNY